MWATGLAKFYSEIFEAIFSTVVVVFLRILTFFHDQTEDLGQQEQLIFFEGLSIIYYKHLSNP